MLEQLFIRLGLMCDLPETGFTLDQFTETYLDKTKIAQNWLEYVPTCRWDRPGLSESRIVWKCQSATVKSSPVID